MAILVSVPGAKITQPWGIAAKGVATKEPAMWASGDRAYWLKYPGATFHQHFHPGTDRAIKAGTRILAIEAGKVLFAGWRNSISGNAIQVEIKDGTRFGFSHCSGLLVEAGMQVARGQAIALVGATGSTDGGAHTHSYVSIKEKGSDGVMRTFLFNPALFEPGGKLQNDARISPGKPGAVVPGGIVPGRLVTLKGPGINVRTTPDLDAGVTNVYATSRPDGIFRNGKRLHANVFSPFAFVRELSNDDGDWVEVFGLNRVLYVHRSLVVMH